MLQAQIKKKKRNAVSVDNSRSPLSLDITASQCIGNTCRRPTWPGRKYCSQQLTCILYSLYDRPFNSQSQLYHHDCCSCCATTCSTLPTTTDPATQRTTYPPRVISRVELRPTRSVNAAITTVWQLFMYSFSPARTHQRQCCFIT